MFYQRNDSKKHLILDKWQDFEIVKKWPLVKRLWSAQNAQKRPIWGYIWNYRKYTKSDSRNRWYLFYAENDSRKLLTCRKNDKILENYSRAKNCLFCGWTWKLRSRRKMILDAHKRCFMRKAAQKITSRSKMTRFWKVEKVAFLLRM